MDTPDRQALQPDLGFAAPACLQYLWRCNPQHAVQPQAQRLELVGIDRARHNGHVKLAQLQPVEQTPGAFDLDIVGHFGHGL